MQDPFLISCSRLAWRSQGRAGAADQGSNPGAANDALPRGRDQAPMEVD